MNSYRQALSGFALSGGAVLAFLGCDSAPSTSSPLKVCTLEARPAVAATVQDANTGAFIASGATLVLQDGAFIDSVAFPAGQANLDGRSLSTPRTYERPGTYVLRIRRPPYADLVVASVVVTHDGCHVQTVALSARLLPKP